MRILLIGKNGQLGQALLAEAKIFGFYVLGFDKDELDVTIKPQIEDMVKKIKPDIFINATAYNLVGVAESEPEKAIAINHKAVADVAEICRQEVIKFITFSTDYVFDGLKGAPYEENDLPNPLQVYGKSKYAGEIAATGNYPQGTYIIRTCGLYGGEKGSPGKGNFVLNILKQIGDESIIEVSSEQIVNPTYAGDLARAALELIQKDAKPGIYHLVNEGHCSWADFAKEILRLAGVGKEIKPIDRGGFSGGVRRPTFSALANKKAKELEIVLPSWQDGLKSYFKFLNERK